MTLVSVPLQPVPAQAVSVTLGGQRVGVRVYQKFFGLFVDLYVNDALVIGGVAARNLTGLVRSAYLGFVGELAFFDTRGVDDPDYSGLGSRFVLLYSDAR